MGIPKFLRMSPILICLPAMSQWFGRAAPSWEKEFQVWVADIHKRVYPNSFGRDLEARHIEIQACRNEFVSFQLGVRSPEPVTSLSIRASDLVSAGGKIDSTSIRVRYPGLMPVDENAQYTPNPLWELPSVGLSPFLKARASGSNVLERVAGGSRSKRLTMAPSRYSGMVAPPGGSSSRYKCSRQPCRRPRVTTAI